MNHWRSTSIVAIALALAGACRCDDVPTPKPVSDPIPAMWQPLADGLSRRTVVIDDTTYQLVRVDLAHFDLRVADARKDGRKSAFVDVLREESKAVVALNGTFFDETERPLGLVVSEGRELNPLRDVSWWAAFVVRDKVGKPDTGLLTTEQLRELPGEERYGLRFALQAGPRTVVDGKPLRLKPQTAARSAICTRVDGTVLLLATEGGGVESNELAAVMATREDDGGFDCRFGVMLDGGPSTQLSIKAGDAAYEVRGGWGVPNAVVVVKR